MSGGRHLISRPMLGLALVLTAFAIGVLGYAWFEAGWLRTRVLDVPVSGLAPELDGLRVAHLSDFHLGPPSRGQVASRRAAEWVARRKPDLVCVTGDLVSHPRGETLLRDVMARLGRPYVVLGNHDVALTRDPFSAASELKDLRATARLLEDEAAVVELRGRRVQLVGVDPRSYRARRSAPVRLVDEAADLRILLCHFPAVWRTLPEGAFHVVLAGHLHAGQLVLPYPGGRLTLAHPKARELSGLYRRGGTVLHVSPGLGTTLVPFRFCARPEVTELVLRSA
jgi:predicted MPP superfamily phosphohydrolase